LLPVRRDTLRGAIASLKAGALIDAYRGGPAGDIEAALDAIEAIAGFAISNSDRLYEMDVNPLIVLAHGAVAADAFIRLAEPDARA
jgi:hypothetical protein